MLAYLEVSISSKFGHLGWKMCVSNMIMKGSKNYHKIGIQWQPKNKPKSETLHISQTKL